jgi:hypothetical protein
MPHLKALDFSTHYISDAECAAIALMTGDCNGFMASDSKCVL